MYINRYCNKYNSVTMCLAMLHLKLESGTLSFSYVYWYIENMESSVSGVFIIKSFIIVMWHKHNVCNFLQERVWKKVYITGDGKPVKIVLGCELQEDSRKQVIFIKNLISTYFFALDLIFRKNLYPANFFFAFVLSVNKNTIR
jgi:hypothetical protein